MNEDFMEIHVNIMRSFKTLILSILFGMKLLFADRFPRKF